MEERRTQLQHRSNQIDPTYYLTNQGTGYTSLWKIPDTFPLYTETRYLCSGLSTTWTTDWASQDYFAQGGAGTVGIRVWKVESGGTETEITNGTPVAVNSSWTSVGGTNTYRATGTWDCPGIDLVSTDEIRVRLYRQNEQAVWEQVTDTGGNEIKFTTSGLGAERLAASTWTVTYYRFYYTPFDNDYLFGDSTYQPKIDNFSYTTVDADDTTIVTIPKNNTGYMKVIPGTENTTILGSLPTSFDGYGWRTDGTLNGQFDAGTWTFYVTLVTNKYVTGDLIVYVRLWKSSNADGSGATALTDWSQIASVSSPSASTTYNLSGSIDLSGLSFSSEYLFVEYVIATTSGTNKDTSVIFRCNEGASQKIVTPSLTLIGPPTVVTNSATNIGTLQATLNGQITDTGEATVDERGFEWGTESGSYPNSWTETGNFGTGSFSHVLSNLQPKTTYYYRAKAHNSEGWGYGSEQSFTTLGYKIEGQCIDEDGNPVDGATVKLYKTADNSYETETTSNPDGSYSFTNLPDNSQRYAIAWKSNTQDRVGTTDNLTPVEEG